MKEFIRDVVIALAIVVLLSFVIKPTIVKESSMEDTLQENNYLFLNKLAYVSKDHPDYGDIIVFQSGIENTEASGFTGVINGLLGKTTTKLLIKRVVGVEGDTISIKDGVVYRNGQELDEDYVKGGYTDGYVEDFVVPEDQLYVMGDNREVSLDSRDSRVGTVSEDAVVGKAFIRLFPFSEICLL